VTPGGFLKNLELLPTLRHLLTTSREWAHDKHEMLNSKFRIRARYGEMQEHRIAPEAVILSEGPGSPARAGFCACWGGRGLPRVFSSAGNPSRRIWVL